MLLSVIKQYSFIIVRGAKYTFPWLGGLLQEPLNPGLTGVGGTTVKTTALGSCNGTEQLYVE